MKMEKRTVTPEMAVELLKMNNGNRNFRSRVVESYAKEMTAGRWLGDTGESIKVSSNGLLLDGQHRLMAVIKANKPVPFLFCLDVQEDAFKVLDSGIPRSSADAFHIEGITYSNNLPSILGYYQLLKGDNSVDNHQKQSTTELLKQYYEKKIFWDEVATKTSTWYNQFGKIISPSMIGSLYATFYDLDDADAMRFMDQLCSGMDIKNKAIGLLRKKLIDDKLATKKMSTKFKYAYIIKAWNFFRKMESPKLLRLDFEKEEFPKAI